ncbi:MAG: VWA domain-containing protein [Selenomonadaceae bacterium]|nr:VWA domain-containing protein [Selenomonadaceae bacterium]
MANIINEDNNVTLNLTATDTLAINSGNNVLINGTAADDSIMNSGEHVTIDAGEGNNSITGAVDEDAGNRSAYGYIKSGTGNDFINIIGDYSSIESGAGNDTVWNSGASDITIDSGAGNDSITNTSGSNVSIDGAAGNDRISNNSTNVTIDSGDGDDEISNFGDNVTISSGTGNDTIYNYYSSNVTIDSGDGDDYIRNVGNNVTISGGAGNDIINNGLYDDEVLVGVSEGKDKSDFGKAVTIVGGTGDDKISLQSSVKENVVQYDLGDGHDTVWGYSNGTALQINSAVGWSSVVSGNNDIVVTVGDGSITLVDAATSSGVNINGVIYPIDNGGGGTESIPPVTLPPDTPVTPVNPAAPTDVIFIIDKSDSMDAYIQRVKDAITSFANSLGSKSSDFRFGIVEFGQSENGGLPVAKTFTLFNGITPYFTSNVEEFTGALDINSNGGMEYGLTAIQTALTMFQADPRLAQKRIVVLTDAGYEGDGTEAEDPSGLTSTDIETALKAENVKMDVVGRLGYECQTEYEPLANSTGGKFYDIDSLSYYNYFEEIADDILGRAHVNINLDIDSVPEGTTSGVFVVTPVLNALGALVPASSDAAFKAAAEEGDFVVGYVVAPNAYMAVPDSPWRQIVTIPENWVVSGTWQDDALNITGSNVVVSGSVGKDNISINEGAININLVDVIELQNGSDTLSFSKKITPGTLQQIFTGTGVALYTTNEAGELDFSINLPGIVALDESLLNCEVSNAGTPNTIRELIYGEVNLPIFGGQDLSGRIIFAQWGYGFTPPEGNPLFVDTSLDTSADLAADFSSPTLDEISPANFAVTANEIPDQNLTAFNPKVAEMILSANKSTF